MIGLHHVGIVTEDAFKFDSKNELRVLLSILNGTQFVHRRVPELQCDCYLYGQVEILIPYGGRLLELLAQRGSFIHHVAFRVPDANEFPQLHRLPDPIRHSDFELSLPCAFPGVAHTLTNFVKLADSRLVIEIVSEEKK